MVVFSNCFQFGKKCKKIQKSKESNEEKRHCMDSVRATLQGAKAIAAGVSPPKNLLTAGYLNSQKRKQENVGLPSNPNENGSVQRFCFPSIQAISWRGLKKQSDVHGDIQNA